MSQQVTDIPHDVGSIRIRQAHSEDASAIWRIVRESGVLDPNSAYLYLILCTDFAETCVVAEWDGALVGFVTAYRPPSRQDVIFVWQIGVAAAGRRRGLGKRLLRHLLQAPACRDVRYLEATVAPSNHASKRLFTSVAESLGVPYEMGLGFTSDDFPEGSHEDEPRIRIGPITTTTPSRVRD
ncbi:MAG: diaminobutyrate acetyltransferase [Planctomycetales bacterium]|nr:diaminobutyrate acetyltransferase [Planctomycetales bacterium]